MIPRRLIFIWLGSMMPEYGRFCIQSFKKVNPSFELMVVEEPEPDITQNEDLKDCMSLLKSEQDSVYKYMVTRPFAKEHLSVTRAQRMTALSDAFRFYLLNKYGGIYLDLDTFPVKPFDDALLSYEGFAPLYKKDVCDWFFLGFRKNCVDDNLITYQEHLFDEEKVHRLVLLKRAYEIFNSNLKANFKKFLMCQLEMGQHVLPKSFFPEYYIDHFYSHLWKKPEVDDIAKQAHVKNISINEMFKHSVVVCVDDTKFDLFSNTFKHYCLPIPRRIGDRVKGQTAVQNCIYNHVECVKHAKDNNWPYVLVFEDDAWPRTDIHQRLESLTTELKEFSSTHEIDLLYLGKYVLSKPSGNDKFFIKCSRQWSSHAYIIFEQFYDAFINIARQMFDNQSKNVENAIDFMYKYSRNAYYCRLQFFEQYSYPNTSKIHESSINSVNYCSNFFADFYVDKNGKKFEFDKEHFDDSWLNDNNLHQLMQSNFNKKRILIVSYFISQEYNSLGKITSWLDNIINHYLIDSERQIIVYTDNAEVEKITDKYKSIVEFRSSFSNVPIDNNLTNRYLKSLYMLDALYGFHEKDFDYVSFIQSNARCVKEINANIIDGTKYLTINSHYWFKKDFNALYRSSGSLICGVEDKDVSKWHYFQSNHFIGKPDNVYRMLSTAIAWQMYDMTNGYLSDITADEGYINWYLNNEIGIKNINILHAKLYDAPKRLDCSEIYFIDKKSNFWKNL